MHGMAGNQPLLRRIANRICIRCGKAFRLNHNTDQVEVELGKRFLVIECAWGFEIQSAEAFWLKHVTLTHESQNRLYSVILNAKWYQGY